VARERETNSLARGGSMLLGASEGEKRIGSDNIVHYQYFRGNIRMLRKGQVHLSSGVCLEKLNKVVFRGRKGVRFWTGESRFDLPGHSRVKLTTFARQRQIRGNVTENEKQRLNILRRGEARVCST
jgi:hypothetical protein